MGKTYSNNLVNQNRMAVMKDDTQFDSYLTNLAKQMFYLANDRSNLLFKSEKRGHNCDLIRDRPETLITQHNISSSKTDD